MTVGQIANLLVLIKRFEGCRLMPYLCPAGVWTCGWGSTGLDVIPGRPWTQAYADRRMQDEAWEKAIGVLAACPELATEPDRRLCALADMAYNCGLPAFRASTLRKRVRARRWDAACDELGRWVRGGGRILRGLVIRRAAEAELLR